jgi:hypothetical protein
MLCKSDTIYYKRAQTSSWGSDLSRRFENKQLDKAKKFFTALAYLSGPSVTKKKKFYEINTWMDSVPYIEEPKSKKDKSLLILISLFILTLGFHIRLESLRG